MNILQNIYEHKRREINERKELYPVKLLEKSMYFDTTPVSLKKYLTRSDKTGIIAEFKRHSPSKGMINQFANVEETTLGYMQSGASALSVLTDSHFFKGSNKDLTLARKANYCPILRKDFTVDEYQIIEAKSIGADAILLIAAILSKDEIHHFTELAHSLKLEVILEIHNKEELNKLLYEIDIIGVNNRNLDTFDVSINNAKDLASILPNEFIRIAESGIHEPAQIISLMEYGYQGFLIGEQFMKESSPQKACQQFISKLKFELKERSNHLQNSFIP